MDFWTFAILIVIIIVAGDIVKKALHSSGQCFRKECKMGRSLKI